MADLGFDLSDSEEDKGHAREDRALMKKEDVFFEDVSLTHEIVVEFLAVFFLVFVVLGLNFAGALVTFDVISSARSFYFSLGYAFVYAGITYGFSYPRGDRRQKANMRHLNPAVTFALLSSGHISFGKALLYWLTQVTACGSATLCIFLLTPLDKQTIFTAYPILDSVNFFQTWVMEFIVSFISILLILITIFGHMEKQPSIAAQLKETAPFTAHELNCIILVGAIFGCAAVASPISGGFMNPLFVIGIKILAGVWQTAGFFVPFIAAIAAVLFGTLFGMKINITLW